MGFWLFILIMDLLIPGVMMVLGKRFQNKAPLHINPIYGYRTSMSMKNQDTWKFAHQYCGKFWFRAGILELPFSILVILTVFGKNNNVIGAVGGILCCAQLVSIIISIYFTEKALKKTFDQNGQRKRP